MACRTSHNPHVDPHPPSIALRCRVLARYPFIWVSLSPSISVPTHDQCWPGEGAGVHGWKESGGDIAEGELGTLWTAAQKPQWEKKGKEKMERERESAARWHLALWAFPNPDDEANWSLTANLYPLDPFGSSVPPPPPPNSKWYPCFDKSWSLHFFKCHQHNLK